MYFAGLRINVRKTEGMAVAKNTSQQLYTEEGTVEISVEGSLVQQVSILTYLEVIISSEGYMDRELCGRKFLHVSGNLELVLLIS